MLTLTVEENQIIEVGGHKLFYRRLKQGSSVKIRLYFDFPRETQIDRTESYSDHTVSRNVKVPKHASTQKTED